MRIKFACEDSPRFAKAECMGDRWGSDLVKEIKPKFNKEIQHAHSKVIVKAALSRFLDMECPHKLHTFLSKKEANQVRIAAKRVVSGRYTPTQLLLWKESQSGQLKCRLDHILEILAYKFDKEQYLKTYCRSLGYYGMSPEDATERFEDYHQELLEKRDYVKKVYDGVKFWGNKK